MVFEAMAVQGAFIIRPERIEDERGFFARTTCDREFAAHGLDPRFVQDSVSYNRRRGTLRGMHYQIAPDEEPHVTLGQALFRHDLHEARIIRCNEARKKSNAVVNPRCSSLRRLALGSKRKPAIAKSWRSHRVARS